MLHLERVNAHPRDSRITFNEREHFYTVDSRRVVGSVSSLWASYFSSFDAPTTALRLLEKWGNREPPKKEIHDPQWSWKYAYEYARLVEGKNHTDTASSLSEKGCASFDFGTDDKGYARFFWYLAKKGVTEREERARALTNLWSSLGTRASERGTFIHRQCELHCNNEDFAVTVETEQYLKFREDHPWLEPYRTEWSVFAYAKGGAHVVAGQIDGLYVDVRDGKYEMIDYKVTAHELNDDNPYRKYGAYPFDDLVDNAYGHYCVQQQVYRYILETEYGIKVARCRLLRLHDTISSYQLIDVKDLRDKVEIVFSQCAKRNFMNVVANGKRYWRKLAVFWYAVHAFATPTRRENTDVREKELAAASEARTPCLPQR
jgi:hypothetical protein